VPRDRKINCPFHEDRTPSLHVYPDPGRGWQCYGCKQGGDIYAFAAKLWGLDTRGTEFLELRARLRGQLLGSETAPGRQQAYPAAAALM
jgi:DNA primase